MIDQPNLVMPLIATQNERGIAGFTNRAADQLKVNALHEIGTNITGESTVYTINRPGIRKTGFSWANTGSDRAYLMGKAPGATGAADSGWIFTKDGNDVDVANLTIGQTIVTASGYVPVYFDVTRISNVETGVVQLRNASSVQRVFFASNIASWTEITDADFTGLSIVGKAVHKWGFMFALASNDRLANSNINSLSGWTAGNYITKQIRQDVSFGLAEYGELVLAFGAETMEPFRNAGKENGSPLESVASGFHKVGMGVHNFPADASNYYARLGDFMYFVGFAAGINASTVGFYAYNGERMEKVSSQFIDKILSEQDVMSVSAVVFSNVSAIAISFHATDSALPEWLMFFPDNKEWFIWTSAVFHPINNGFFFLPVTTRPRDALVFDATDSDWFDDGETVTFRHQFKMPSNGNQRKTMGFCSVVGDTTASAHALNVSFSEDGTTYGTARSIDMSSKEKMLRRCGTYRQRYVKLTSAVNQGLRLEKFIARVS